MIPRRAADHVLELARGFLIVSITGPRQSGKTTLTRACFADCPYVNLESPAERAMATADPLGFLARFPDGAILDEIQPILVHGGDLETELLGCRVAGWSRLDGALAAMPPR